jgi:hypothetical protein
MDSTDTPGQYWSQTVDNLAVALHSTPDGLGTTEVGRRLENLKSVTEEGGGRGRFWFGLASELDAERVLSAPVWQVAGREVPAVLIEPV